MNTRNVKDSSAKPRLFERLNLPQKSELEVSNVVAAVIVTFVFFATITFLLCVFSPPQT